MSKTPSAAVKFQLSNTPYYADSPKGHVIVIVEETKRTPSLALYKTLTTYHKQNIEQSIPTQYRNINS